MRCFDHCRPHSRPVAYGGMAHPRKPLVPDFERARLSPMSRLMCHRCRDSRQWRARRDSNPRPSDPKSVSRQRGRSRPIRAWNGHREDAVFVDSGVSLVPAPERVLVPSWKPGRVRCPRRVRRFFKCPRRHSELCASTRPEPPGRSGRRYGDEDVRLAGRRSGRYLQDAPRPTPPRVRSRRRLNHSGAPDTADRYLGRERVAAQEPPPGLDSRKLRWTLPDLARTQRYAARAITASHGALASGGGGKRRP